MMIIDPKAYAPHVCRNSSKHEFIRVDEYGNRIWKITDMKDCYPNPRYHKFLGNQLYILYLDQMQTDINLGLSENSMIQVELN